MEKRLTISHFTFNLPPGTVRVYYNSNDRRDSTQFVDLGFIECQFHSVDFRNWLSNRVEFETGFPVKRGD